MSDTKMEEIPPDEEAAQSEEKIAVPDRTEEIVDDVISDEQKLSSQESFHIENNEHIRNETVENHSVVKVEKVEEIVPLEVVNVEMLISRFKGLITIPSFNPSMLTKEHMVVIEEFLTAKGTRRLLLFVDETQKDEPVCCIQTTMPSKLHKQVMYFIRESTRDDDVLTEKNFGQRVQYVTSADFRELSATM
jgi:hypothetical protein